MIEYLFIALALFWIFRFLGMLVEFTDETPEWVHWIWVLMLPAAAALSLAPWDQSWVHWFTPFAIAGIVVFFQLVENWLIAKADEAVTTVMRATARRPR